MTNPAAVVRFVRPGDKCEYADCDRDATDLAYSRHMQSVMALCQTHRETVMDEGHPEYHDYCANCGCGNPIN